VYRGGHPSDSAYARKRHARFRPTALLGAGESGAAELVAQFEPLEPLVPVEPVDPVSHIVTVALE
jgi:hypothetical protein